MSTRDAFAPALGARSTPSNERPRLALRFEAGRGIIALARPLAFHAGAVTLLEADLGRLPSPVDLRAGASRFRHRRASTLRVEVRVDLDELARSLSEDDASVRVLALAADATAIPIALRDPIRTIALDLVPAWHGDDLVLALREVRAAIDGPRAAIVDALAILQALGARHDRALGVLRIADPLRHALSEAMLPHGWRVPELRALARAAPRIEGRMLVMRAGGSRTDSDAPHADAPPPQTGDTRRALEHARALAP
ncbi:MAG: hypothetical protein M3Y87_32485, partial [Myxococcota bacterium]|nr:hypothetical protein [Myxococcota bacterium]